MLVNISAKLAAGMSHTTTLLRASSVSIGSTTDSEGSPSKSPGSETDVNWREASGKVIALAAHPSSRRNSEALSLPISRIASPRSTVRRGNAILASSVFSSPLNNPNAFRRSIAWPSYCAKLFCEPPVPFSAFSPIDIQTSESDLC